MRYLVGTIRAIEFVNEHVGRTVAWLVLSMLLIAFAVATLRYGFSLGWIWFQELYVWMHGTIFMVGVGYALLHDSHVRVDVFYRNASTRAKAWINMIGVVVFLFPTVGVLTWVILPYVLLSWGRLETSREASGMQGLFILKTMMLLFCLFLFLQGLALLFRSVLVLSRHPEFQVEPEEEEGV